MTRNLKEFGVMLKLPKCDLCRRCYEEEYKCDAFPNGIPNKIMWEPEEKECNNGIKFLEDD